MPVFSDFIQSHQVSLVVAAVTIAGHLIQRKTASIRITIVRFAISSSTLIQSRQIVLSLSRVIQFLLHASCFSTIRFENASRSLLADHLPA